MRASRTRPAAPPLTRASANSGPQIRTSYTSEIVFLSSAPRFYGALRAALSCRPLKPRLGS
jgi:hypothetical protein